MLENEDSELVARVARGDEDAFLSLYERYAGRVHGLAARILGEAMAAEEATQDTFLKLWNHAGQFARERGSLQVWLLTIARRTAIDRLRRDGRRPESSGASDPEAAWSSIADEASRGQDAGWRSLAFAVRALPHDLRRAIELAYYGGLSQSEIAQELGWPLGTVKSRLRAAMEHLRREWMGEDSA